MKLVQKSEALPDVFVLSAVADRYAERNPEDEIVKAFQVVNAFVICSCIVLFSCSTRPAL